MLRHFKIRSNKKKILLKKLSKRIFATFRESDISKFAQARRRCRWWNRFFGRTVWRNGCQTSRRFQNVDLLENADFDLKVKSFKSFIVYVEIVNIKCCGASYFTIFYWEDDYLKYKFFSFLVGNILKVSWVNVLII